jgi:hypothetical protein
MSPFLKRNMTVAFNRFASAFDLLGFESGRAASLR